MHRSALVAGLVLALVGTGESQQRDTARADTTRLPELEARVVRPLTTVGGASALRLRIDSVPLPAAPTFEQALRHMPMLHIRTNSRGEAEITGRGSESRQVAVLVDGIPITLAWDGRADASVIPTTGFSDVNYVRGLSSMLHGPNVLGGIIEIEVGQSSFVPSSPNAQLAAGFDHLGGYRGNASVAVPVASQSGTWIFRGGMGYWNIPGVPLAEGITEPTPTDDDLRANTDAQNIDGFASLRYESNGGGWFAFSGSSYDGERGIAAELGYDDARFWRYPNVSRTLLFFSGGTGSHRSPFGGEGDLEASFGIDQGRTDIDSYTSRSYTEVDGFENGKDRTLTFRLLGDQTLGGRGDLQTAFTVSEIRHDESLPSGEARYRQRLWSLGAETIWRLIDGGQGINNLRLSVGGAYDIGETPETGGREPGQDDMSEWGGRIGLTMVASDGRLTAHTGISRRGRFPALRELYSGALNRFVPNPDLKPENLVAFEAGVTARPADATELQLVGFHHQMNDAVVRITLPDNRFVRVNRNQLTSTGVEMVASTLLGRFALGGDLTLQSVELTDTDAGEAHQPENMPETYGGGYARVSLPLGFQVGTEARYTGSQFCIDPATGEDAQLDAGTIINGDVAKQFQFGRAGQSWLSRFEVRLGVDNLGDAALYDQCRLPEPGRLLRLQVRVF